MVKQQPTPCYCHTLNKATNTLRIGFKIVLTLRRNLAFDQHQSIWASLCSEFQVMSLFWKQQQTDLLTTILCGSNDASAMNIDL